MVAAKTLVAELWDVPFAMAEGSRKPSTRARWPRICNALIWLVFCVLSGTGLMLAWKLPPGSQGGRGLSVLGWGRHDWGDLHSWASYAFIALIAVHLALHWRWFWQIAASKRRWPLVVGIGGGLLVIVTLVLLPVADRQQPEGDHDGHGRQHRKGWEE